MRAQTNGSEQSVPPNGRSLIEATASSRRCRGLIASSVSAASDDHPRDPVAVKPTVVTSGSVAVRTRASAADASRQEIGRPDTGEAIDPETSRASRVRLPAGRTAPNAT